MDCGSTVDFKRRISLEKAFLSNLAISAWYLQTFTPQFRDPVCIVRNILLVDSAPVSYTHLWVVIAEVGKNVYTD